MKFELIAALALGDGSLVDSSVNLTKLVIRHSTHQKDYCYWKYNLDYKFWTKEPRLYENYNKGKKYFGVELRTPGLVELKELKKVLYPSGKKEYTRDFLEILDPQGLAIWLMDDGCIDNPIGRKPMGILNTYGHTPNGAEELIIQKYFKEKWNIECSLNKNHGRHRLRFNNTNYTKLVHIVEPYFLDTLKYKINLTLRHGAPDSRNRDEDTV